MSSTVRNDIILSTVEGAAGQHVEGAVSEVNYSQMRSGETEVVGDVDVDVRVKTGNSRRSALIGTVLTLCLLAAMSYMIITQPEHPRKKGKGGKPGGKGSSSPGVMLQFAQVTDLHYNPHYDPTCSGQENEQCDGQRNPKCKDPSHPPLAPSAPFGRGGCGAPRVTVEAFLNNLASHQPPPQFLLLTGDIPRAKSSGENKWGMMQQVFDMFSKVLPDMKVIYALGNNCMDVDYCWARDGDVAWRRRIGNALPPNWLQDRDNFMKGGYQSHAPVLGLRILTLNTVIYTPHVCRPDSDSTKRPGVTAPPKGTCEYEKFKCESDARGKAFRRENSAPDDPLGQFAWLESELQKAQSGEERVLLHGHIPPINDPFDKGPLWLDKYRRRYNALLAKYADTIDLQLMSHVHQDLFVTDAVDKGFVPVLLTPSLSPQYGNNPSYRVYDYVVSASSQRFQRIQDYTQYFLDLWATRKYAQVHPSSPVATREPFLELYSFREAYAPATLSQPGLIALKRRLRDEPSLMAAFLGRQRSGWYNPADLLCSLESSSQDNFSQCVRNSQ